MDSETFSPNTTSVSIVQPEELTERDLNSPLFILILILGVLLGVLFLIGFLVLFRRTRLKRNQDDNTSNTERVIYRAKDTDENQAKNNLINNDYDEFNDDQRESRYINDDYLDNQQPKNNEKPRYINV